MNAVKSKFFADSDGLTSLKSFVFVVQSMLVSTTDVRLKDSMAMFVSAFTDILQSHAIPM